MIGPLLMWVGVIGAWLLVVVVGAWLWQWLRDRRGCEACGLRAWQVVMGDDTDTWAVCRPCAVAWHERTAP